MNNLIIPSTHNVDDDAYNGEMSIRSGEHFEVGLIEEGSIDHRSHLHFLYLHQSCQFQASNQVDSLAEGVLIEEVEVVHEWS